jgi:uncharacterized protein YciI
MKHFLVDIIYLVPFEKIEEILPAHRSFLQTGYDMGILLMSGPKEPRSGGYVIARSETKTALENYFDHDPYKVNGVASHNFVEFNPVKFQPWLDDWIKGK